MWAQNSNTNEDTRKADTLTDPERLPQGSGDGTDELLCMKQVAT